ncbi:MAG: hypothetical protein GY862_23845 [Gammaproteobacteria bacterium]|nr:hypothetical protein [Gammaproteobacteria bacterium]
MNWICANNLSRAETCLINDTCLKARQVSARERPCPEPPSERASAHPAGTQATLADGIDVAHGSKR